MLFFLSPIKQLDKNRIFKMSYDTTINPSSPWKSFAEIEKYWKHALIESLSKFSHTIHVNFNRIKDFFLNLIKYDVLIYSEQFFFFATLTWWIYINIMTNNV